MRCAVRALHVFPLTLPVRVRQISGMTSHLAQLGFTKQPKMIPKVVRANLKKRMQQDERLAEIEAENARLLSQMTRIMDAPDQLSRLRRPPLSSLNVVTRRKEMERVTHENLRMLRALEETPSYYNHRVWNAERREQEHLLSYIGMYPYHDGTGVRSKSHARSHTDVDDVWLRSVTQLSRKSALSLPELTKGREMRFSRTESPGDPWALPVLPGHDQSPPGRDAALEKSDLSSAGAKYPPAKDTTKLRADSSSESEGEEDEEESPVAKKAVKHAEEPKPSAGPLAAAEGSDDDEPAAAAGAGHTSQAATVAGVAPAAHPMKESEAAPVPTDATPATSAAPPSRGEGTPPVSAAAAPEATSDDKQEQAQAAQQRATPAGGEPADREAPASDDPAAAAEGAGGAEAPQDDEAHEATAAAASPASPADEKTPPASADAPVDAAEQGKQGQDTAEAVSGDAEAPSSATAPAEQEPKPDALPDGEEERAPGDAPASSNPTAEPPAEEESAAVAGQPEPAAGASAEDRGGVGDKTKDEAQGAKEEPAVTVSSVEASDVALTPAAAPAAPDTESANAAEAGEFVDGILSEGLASSLVDDVLSVVPEGETAPPADEAAPAFAEPPPS